MLQTVDVGERSLGSYRGVAADHLLDEVATVAEVLRGARVLHLNATPYGGGVSELLRSTVPLLNDLGLIADWKIIGGEQTFFEATKAIHNGLQGAPDELTAQARAVYLKNAEANAARLEERYDFVFVHDPQPAAVLQLHGRGDAVWIWRCHIDTSRPDPAVWAFLRPYLRGYDAAIFTIPEFLPPEFPVDRVEVFPPAIDPLSPKNVALTGSVATQVLEWIGMRLDRPLVTQVSRFDPWKDPLGVIAAYRLARAEIPNLQLALVGSMALDDPEGWEIYREISEESEADPLIRVFTNLAGVGNIEVNAFQRLSEVVVQKSTREGFGLVVSEALWKGTPVVAGRAGGIPLQMADGVGGRLIEDVDGCARALVELLSDPDLARGLAESGRERVREHFLLPRLLLNELSLMLELSRGRAGRRFREVPSVQLDPVCGMAIDPERAQLAEYEGKSYRFCSVGCRERFLIEPRRYVPAENA